MKKITRFFVLIVSALAISSPSHAVEWAMTFGGSDWDGASSIQQTAGGGYIVAGYSQSFGAGNYDFWILNLNPDGTVGWQKTYGGNYNDRAYSVQQTAGGGYIVAGYSYSFGAGDWDIWVLELNSDGTIAWQKTYGGVYVEEARSIQQTAGGGYIVAGLTNSFGAGNVDFWILNLNPDGTVGWQKTYGGAYDDYAYSIQEIAGGGYIVAGSTRSFGAGYEDVLVLKLNSDGTVGWQKTYGGSSYDYAQSIRQTADGGYVVAGSTSSFGAGAYDFWVLKLNSDGTVGWQKTYGGAYDDYAYSIQEIAGGGYIVAGETYSFGAGGRDLWVLKLDSTGTIVSQNTYGGSYFEEAYSIQEIAGGGYIVAGQTSSFGAGGFDFWVSKLNSGGEIPYCSAMGTSSATVTDTSVVDQNASVTPQDTSVAPSNTTISPLDTSAMTSVVCHSLAFNVQQEVMYDGYLDKAQDGVLVDTFITVTHGNNNPVPAKIKVYDKYGIKLAVAPLLNGGEALESNAIPANGFGWVTLGMIVNRTTQNPVGSPGGEKFTFKISTGKSDYQLKPTIVQVKQVTYKTRQENPGEAIWNPANIATWSETALGGKLSPGLLHYPNNWP